MSEVATTPKQRAGVSEGETRRRGGGEAQLGEEKDRGGEGGRGGERRGGRVLTTICYDVATRERERAGRGEKAKHKR